MFSPKDYREYDYLIEIVSKTCNMFASEFKEISQISRYIINDEIGTSERPCKIISEFKKYVLKYKKEINIANVNVCVLCLYCCSFLIHKPFMFNEKAIQLDKGISPNELIYIEKINEYFIMFFLEYCFKLLSNSKGGYLDKEEPYFNTFLEQLTHLKNDIVGLFDLTIFSYSINELYRFCFCK